MASSVTLSYSFVSHKLFFVPVLACWHNMADYLVLGQVQLTNRRLLLDDSFMAHLAPSDLLTFKTSGQILKPTCSISDQRFGTTDNPYSAPPPDDCSESRHFWKGVAPPPLYPCSALLHFYVVLLKNLLWFPSFVFPKFLEASKVSRHCQTTFTDFQVINFPSVCFQSSFSLTSHKQLWCDK